MCYLWCYIELHINQPHWFTTEAVVLNLSFMHPFRIALYIIAVGFLQSYVKSEIMQCDITKGFPEDKLSSAIAAKFTSGTAAFVILLRFINNK